MKPAGLTTPTQDKVHHGNLGFYGQNTVFGVAGFWSENHIKPGAPEPRRDHLSRTRTAHAGEEPPISYI